MRPSSLLSALALTASLALARPTLYASPNTERALFDGPTVLNDVVLFDAPAFPDPQNPANTLAFFQTYVSLRSPDLGIATAAVSRLLSSLGIDVGNKINILQERVKLLASIGIPGKNIEVAVPGCSETATLPSTSLRDLGLATGPVSLGSCLSSTQPLDATMIPGPLDNRKVVASIFPSPNSGFGVISDIDDTVKISNVLDTGALLKSTFLDEPKVVPGMPELYSSLAASLQGPQFVYITGSPYQFYPVLNNFIDTSYSDAKGPIFTKNLTVINIPDAIKVFTDDEGTLNYKIAMIDRLESMYPQKKWLAIGDSTQKDPEAYAAAFKKHPGFISCIWVRRVANADNSESRFNAAFTGIPQENIRLFDDSEIPSLIEVDVAGGQC